VAVSVTNGNAKLIAARRNELFALKLPHPMKVRFQSKGPSGPWPAHVSALRLSQHCGSRSKERNEMKAPLVDRTLELAILSAVAALACGLASIQGDLLFVVVFGAASVITIIEALRRLR
jgi:hypothetical protein